MKSREKLEAKVAKAQADWLAASVLFRIALEEANKKKDAFEKASHKDSRARERFERAFDSLSKFIKKETHQEAKNP